MRLAAAIRSPSVTRASRRFRRSAATGAVDLGRLRHLGAGERVDAAVGVVDRRRLVLDGAGEHPVVAAEDGEGGAVDRAVLLREVEELVVHRLVADAVDQQLRAGPQGLLGLGEAGGVDDQRQVVRARLLAGGVDGGGGLLHRMVLVDDVPDLHRRGAARGQVAHAGPRRVGVGEDHELALGGEVQPVVDGRQERPGGGDPRHLEVGLGPGGQPQGPGVAADVEDRGHPGAEVGAAEALGVAGEVGDRLVVGVAVAGVERVGAAVRPAGLGEMDVGVDEARG